MKALIIFILLILFQSCIKIPDEELTMIRVPYMGNEIKINGYYYAYSRSYPNYTGYMTFYSNGVMLELGFYTNDTKLSTVFENIKKHPYKDNWGLFNVNDKIISVQSWRQNPGPYNYILKDYKCYILNDTTFYKIYSDRDTTIYHFVEFSPKPDSTNIYIL